MSGNEECDGYGLANGKEREMGMEKAEDLGKTCGMNLICEKVRRVYGEIEKLNEKLDEIEEKIIHKSQKQTKWSELLSKAKQEFNKTGIEQEIAKIHSLKAQRKHLKDEVNRICQLIEEQETIFFESETYSIEEKLQLIENKKKFEALHKVLTDKQDENITLINQLESLEQPKKRKKKHLDQIEREEKLRDAYQSLEIESNTVQQNRKTLYKVIITAEKEIHDKDTALAEIHARIDSCPNSPDIETSTLKNLSNTLTEQRNLIEALKNNLKSSPLPDPLHESLCKCKLF
jgi:chromosome segregation ATPase